MKNAFFIQKAYNSRKLLENKSAYRYAAFTYFFL